MPHLTLEAIARLVDEAPEPEEALHLQTCLVCRRELSEMRLQTEELAQLPDPEPSPAAWTAIEARLQAEGLVRRRRAFPEYTLLRIAASVAVLVMGSAAGVALWSGGDTHSPDTPYLAPPVAVTPAPARAPEIGAVPTGATGTGSVVQAAALEPADPEAEPAVQAAPRGRVVVPAPRRARPGEGTGLREAETEYLRALEEYARMAAAEDADPVTRLATLEGLVRATRSALERAPDDPVINGYHLAAIGARDATLRQLARSSEETWY
ncbi:MAG TPA: hypothetical protein VHG28_00115 [Longimicrobiaceae bacterium]|nr:hypothetical protein [Longimicrobiaceae bacterium]